MRSHQRDQDVFRSVLPEDIDWHPFPAFPPSVRLAIVVGHPTEPGPYLIRVKVPSGVKLMPHWHQEDRIYTVISGIFYIGLGDQFDGEELGAYPPGAVIVLPGGTPHFHWAKSGEYVTQVTAIGPLNIEYLDQEHDPRNRRAGRLGEGQGGGEIGIEFLEGTGRPGYPGAGEEAETTNGIVGAPAVVASVLDRTRRRLAHSAGRVRKRCSSPW